MTAFAGVVEETMAIAEGDVAADPEHEPTFLKRAEPGAAAGIGGL
jgi:hypothetical protein